MYIFNIIYMYMYMSIHICDMYMSVCVYVFLFVYHRFPHHELPCPEGLCSDQLVLQQNIVEGPVGVDIAMDLGISLAGAETLR